MCLLPSPISGSQSCSSQGPQNEYAFGHEPPPGKVMCQGPQDYFHTLPVGSNRTNCGVSTSSHGLKGLGTLAPWDNLMIEV